MERHVSKDSKFLHNRSETMYPRPYHATPKTILLGSTQRRDEVGNVVTVTTAFGVTGIFPVKINALEPIFIHRSLRRVDEGLAVPRIGTEVVPCRVRRIFVSEVGATNCHPCLKAIALE